MEGEVKPYSELWGAMGHQHAVVRHAGQDGDDHQGRAIDRVSAFASRLRDAWRPGGSKHGVADRLFLLCAPGRSRLLSRGDGWDTGEDSWWSGEDKHSLCLRDLLSWGRGPGQLRPDRRRSV